MTTYNWKFETTDGLIHADIWYDTETKQFTIASIKGSFDLNALWVSDGDKTAGEGGITLSKNEKSIAMSGIKMTWDDVGILSMPGKPTDVQGKPSYIAEGDMKTFDLSDFQGLDDAWFNGITDFSDITLGIRATSVNGTTSIKMVATNALSLDSIADVHHILYHTDNFFALQGDNTTDTGATDTLTVLTGTVYLENQYLQLPEGHEYTFGIGDVFYVGAKNGATVYFGSDQILGSTSDDRLFGDLDADASSDAYPGGGTYNFGNDELYGANGDDTIYGDARQLGNFPSLPDTGAEYQGTYNTGSDDILGGMGNDYLIGDIDQGNSGVFKFASDKVLGDGGIDTLVGDVTYLLAFSDPISATCGNDKLSGGSDNDEIYGDAGYVVSYDGIVTIAFGDDVLSGGDGDDVLYGDALGVMGPTIVTRQGNDVLAGGNGNDYLVGGGGADQFVFDTRPNSITNVDTIEDFSAAEGDKLVLHKSVFAKLSTATLPQDLGAKLIYDNTTGALSYDADGLGAGRAETICILANTPATLTADSFLIV